MSVRTAIEIAQFFRAIITGPHRLTEAGLSLKIEISVTAAVWQALQCLLVHLTAIGSLPTLFTDARALGAKTVARASWMRTINFLAILPLVAAYTVAFAVGAVTMAVAVGHLTFIVSQGALFALPTGIALTLAVYILASLTTKNRTDTLAAIFTTETRIALTMT